MKYSAFLTLTLLTIGNIAFAQVAPETPDKDTSVSYRISRQANEVDIVGQDASGRPVARVKSVEHETIDVKYDLPGQQTELHLKDKGNDVEGTIKHNSAEMTIDAKIENGRTIGRITQIENGYRQVIDMNADGTYKLQIQDPKTNEVLYTVTGTQDSDGGKVYDGKGKLIAEGVDEDNMTIYDEKAYRLFEKMTEDEDDEG